MAETIGILMATYNGARYLEEQLSSLAAQIHRNWHLHVRDDESSDGTPAILTDFASAYPGRVTCHADDLGRLGARANFVRLMALAPERYIGFCDQDDIWHPGKLSASLNLMRRLEVVSPVGHPCLVHADRQIVDSAGAKIAPSYWNSRGLNPAMFRGPEGYYAFCLAAGSTMLLNRPLLNLAWPVPAEARMYDCWIELVAHAFGTVGWLETPVIDHRRHGANTSGAASDIDSAAARQPWARAARLFRHLDRQRTIYRSYFLQAAAFRRHHGIRLSVEAVRRLDLFLSVPDKSLLGRIWALLRCGAFPPGLPRKMALAGLAGVSARAVNPRSNAVRDVAQFRK